MPPRPTPRGARGGFTLVELVTAASLMTVMMLGVVEIFGIVVETASEAEGIHFAQQQARAFFNRLHTDIRGMTREGYLTIRKGAVSGTGAYTYQQNQSAAGNPQRYGADTLAFVTVGSCQSQMDDSPRHAACAEVVYTNHVETPSQMLRLNGDLVAPRRGILGRGLWLLSGIGGGGPWSGQSSYQYLCDLFATENEVPAPQGPPGAAGTSLCVEPWVPQQAPSSADPSLNRVMACCVSEFYVEALTPVSTGGDYWHGDEDAARTYRWSDSFVSGGEPLKYLTGEKIETWPPAIRVTVAIHDPGETSDIPEGQKRFRGYAMQETFWLGDP